MAAQEATVLGQAAELARLPREERALRFRLLDTERAAAVFDAFDAAYQQELVEDLRDPRIAELLEAMEPDDRARLFDELPAPMARRLLAGLSPDERRLTSIVLGYPAESAGRIMSPEVVVLRDERTAGEALARVRGEGRRADSVYVLPVVGEDDCLAGTVTLRDLVLAGPEEPLDRLVRRDAEFVHADADQEAAVRLMQEADLVALPVVDGEHRLLGLVTVDDALDLLSAEEAEDLARIGAAEPLRRPYLSVSVRRIVRARIVWLLVLVAAATLTVSVLDAFEATLEQAVTLALFIPLLIGTGGNAGAQAATTMTRALAVGDVRFGDLGRVVFRETRVGLLLGSLFGALFLGPVWAIFGQDIAVVVSLTLVAICTLATFAGSLLPLVASRVGVDPAVVSAPLITTLVDATGLVIYFLIAQAVLGL